MELLETIVITLFTLAILVSIHEYGHFWVARKCGIKVLRFSVGFGKPLCRWTDKLGTEYVIAAIPLGGYVKMLDEREGEVPEDQRHMAFNNQSVWSRLATVAAGPAANFILAILVYWVVFMGGVSGVSPTIEKVELGSVAELAGLQAGQEFVAVDGHATPTWEALHLQLLERIGDTGEIEFTVKYPDSDLRYSSTASVDAWLAGEEVTDLMAGIGVELYRPKLIAEIDKVVAGSPAELSGFKAGDIIVQADEQAIKDWQGWVAYVRERPKQQLNIRFLREGAELTAVLTPAEKFDEEGTPFGQVGMGVKWPEWPEEMRRDFQYGPLLAVKASMQRTWDMSVFTLQSIKKMLMGLISPKNLSGPITIAKVASASAKSGLSSYLSFLALLSVSLGVLNLLPIPVLDGGHILFGVVELLIGRPVSERIQALGYKLGFFMVISMMMLALYNDISRL
ncbi:MAG: regulator of sigma E protease [Pseudohongiellaceae bacterium]|jgi:regulator of sigma E protease